MKTLCAPIKQPNLGDLRCRCEFLWLPRSIEEPGVPSSKLVGAHRGDQNMHM